MKKYFILVSAAVLTILFNCCDRNPEERNVQIILQNDSGQPLKIFDINSISIETLNIFEIATGDEIVQRFVEIEGQTQKGPFDFFEGDSILVVFGNKERFLTYKCPRNSFVESCERNGNILNIADARWNLEIGNDEGSAYIYRFIPQDFEDAEPCNDNCN